MIHVLTPEPLRLLAGFHLRKAHAARFVLVFIGASRVRLRRHRRALVFAHSTPSPAPAPIHPLHRVQHVQDAPRRAQPPKRLVEPVETAEPCDPPARVLVPEHRRRIDPERLPTAPDRDFERESPSSVAVVAARVVSPRVAVARPRASPRPPLDLAAHRAAHRAQNVLHESRERIRARLRGSDVAPRRFFRVRLVLLAL